MNRPIDPYTGDPIRRHARAPRPGTEAQTLQLYYVAKYLRAALVSAKAADCPRLCAKIRSALKSQGGAGRHLMRRWNFTEANPRLVSHEHATNNKARRGKSLPSGSDRRSKGRNTSRFNR